MATANVKTPCSICEEEMSTFICRGCSKDFCFNHLTEHRQFLNTQLHYIQNDYNQFRQRIIDLKNNPEQHLLIEEIDQWEINSIEKIKQRAKQCREILINYTIEILNQVELKLNHSNEQLIPLQNNLDQLRGKLEQLKRELNQPTNLPI
jgi:chromosome segregation ATPase